MYISLTIGFIALFSILGFYIFTQEGKEESSANVISSEEINPEVIEETAELAGDQSLNLSGQNLSKVPDYVFTQAELVELDLSGNSLSGSLPAEVRHLSNLKHLNLSNNQFTGVPAEIGQLSRLEILDLSNNQLTGLPHELGNLQNLKTLDLRGNSPSEFDLKIIQESIPSAIILVD
jgi:Leucine-rich repeat (LRR) protein